MPRGGVLGAGRKQVSPFAPRNDDLLRSESQLSRKSSLASSFGELRREARPDHSFGFTRSAFALVPIAALLRHPMAENGRVVARAGPSTATEAAGEVLRIPAPILHHADASGSTWRVPQTVANSFHSFSIR